MCPIANFAKGGFSEILRRDRTIIFITRIALLLKSAESTVAIEPIALYSIKIFISIHTSEYISHRQKHDFTIKSIPPGAHAFERIRLRQQQKSGFCKKSDLFKKQVGCVHSQIVEKCV